MYLRVLVSRSNRWKFDYRLDGKDCSHTLERFPDPSISDARQHRNDAAKLVASGIHPKAYEKQLQLQTITHNKNTFWAVCEDWIEDNRDRWSEYYCGQAIRFLSRYVRDSPLGKMPVRDIKVVHVYDLLQSIAKRKTLSGDERLLTSVRTVELRGATWKEIDLKSAIWVIPGERTKMGHPLLAPLSTQAIEILKEMRSSSSQRHKNLRRGSKFGQVQASVDAPIEAKNSA